jgi:hypothetical protein
VGRFATAAEYATEKGFTALAALLQAAAATQLDEQALARNILARRLEVRHLLLLLLFGVLRVLLGAGGECDAGCGRTRGSGTAAVRPRARVGENTSASTAHARRVTGRLLLVHDAVVTSAGTVLKGPAKFFFGGDVVML